MGYLMLAIINILLCISCIVITRNTKPITMNKIIISMIICAINIWLAIAFFILWILEIFI